MPPPPALRRRHAQQGGLPHCPRPAPRRHGGAALQFSGRSQGVHAHLTGEIEDARAALGWLRARYPNLGFALAGFSFGARVVTRLGCGMAGARFVLAAGFPTRMGAADYLEACAVPKIFLQSTHDEFGPPAELDALFATLAEPKELIYIEAADHFFAGGLDELEEHVVAVAR
jgi:alpha/beta superfamily hydrolase